MLKKLFQIAFDCTIDPWGQDVQEALEDMLLVQWNKATKNQRDDLIEYLKEEDGFIDDERADKFIKKIS